MALTYVGCTTNSSGNANSINTTVTVPAATSKRILIVFIAVLDDILRNITGVTCGGNALTLVSTESRSTTKLEVWKLENVNMPAAGSRTLAVTVNNPSRIVVAAHFVSNSNPIVILNNADGNTSATGITVNLNNTGKNGATTLALSCGVASINSGWVFGTTLPTWTNASSITESADFGTEVTDFMLCMGTGRKSQSDAGAFTHVWNHNYGSSIDVLGAGVVLDEDVVHNLTSEAEVEIGASGYISYDHEFSGSAGLEIQGTGTISGGLAELTSEASVEISGQGAIAGVIALQSTTQLNIQGSGAITISDYALRWSIEHLEARTDYGFPTVYVEINSTEMPSGAFPTGEFFERRLLELPRLEEAEFGSRFGITGFRQVTLVLDNSDGLISSLELQDSYVRLFFADEAGNTREWKGRVTSWTLSHRCTVTVEDVDAIALTQELPRRTLNDIVEAEKVSVPSFEPVADDLGKPIPIVFGRAKKVPLLYIKEDDTNREYDYAIGEGVGLDGHNFQEVFTAYREDQALDDIEGDVAAATSTTLTLETADRRPDSWYRYWWVEITAGTGAGQIRHITAYDSANNRITVNSSWSVTPNSGSDYRLREWRFFNGSQASPYVGVAFIRFKKRMGVQGRVDAIYADVNGFPDETNPVRAIESILSNDVWGLGLDVDSTSFDTAAALPAIDEMLCEGVIGDTTTIQDILEGSGDVQGLLSFRDMVLSKGDSIEIAVDQSKVSAHIFGLGDETGWNNILTQSPEIVHLHPSEKVKNLKVRYRKNNKENDSYQHELSRQASPNGVDRTLILPFVYDHETADRWLDYRRKRIAAASKQLAIEVGQEGGSVHRGERVTIHIPTLGLEDSNWEITSCSVTPAGANSLSLVPYSASPYTYVPVTDEGGSLPVDASFAIPPDYSTSLPDPLSNIVIAMQREVVGFTAYSYATFTFTPPEDNYGGAVVRVKELADADSLYRVVFSAKGDQVNSGRTATLTPGRLYVFSFTALNIDGSKEGLGIVMDNSGAGYLGGGDSTAPATPTGLTGASKFGELIWTWNKNSEADVAYYEIEIYTATSGGSLLVKDEVIHLNDSSFTPIYKYTRQTGSLTSALVGAARIRAVDHSGNASSYTSRIGATTDAVAREDAINEDFNKQYTDSNNSSIDLLNPSWATLASFSGTFVSGQTLFVHGSFRVRVSSPSALSQLWYQVLYDGGVIYGDTGTTSGFGIFMDGAGESVGFSFDHTPSSGNHTYTLRAQMNNTGGTKVATYRRLTADHKKR